MLFHWNLLWYRIVTFNICICHVFNFIVPLVTAQFEWFFLREILALSFSKTQILTDIFFVTCSTYINGLIFENKQQFFRRSTKWSTHMCFGIHPGSNNHSFVVYKLPSIQDHKHMTAKYIQATWKEWGIDKILDKLWSFLVQLFRSVKLRSSLSQSKLESEIRCKISKSKPE